MCVLFMAGRAREGPASRAGTGIFVTSTMLSTVAVLAGMLSHAFGKPLRSGIRARRQTRARSDTR